MSNVGRFLQYAEAFERAVENGDWSEVSRFFTESAVYESRAKPPMEGLAEGREAIIGHFQTTVATFDSRFKTRGIKFLEGPVDRDGAVTGRFEARLGTDGAPDLTFSGSLLAEFEGDSMSLLRDTIEADQIDSMMDWLTTHAGKLATADPRVRPDRGAAIALGPNDGTRHVQSTGGHATVKLAEENFPVNGFSLGTQSVPPHGATAERSFARGEIVYFVERGEGVAVLDDVDHVLCAGTTVVVSRGVRHTLRNNGESDLEIFWLSFPPGTERLLASGGSCDWFEGPPQLPGREGASLLSGASLVVKAEEAASYWQPSPNDGYVDVLVSPYNYASNQFAMGTQWMAPKTLLPDHTHSRNEEVLYVLEGRGKAFIDGAEIAVEPGSLLYAGRWVKHGFLADSDEPLKLLWVFLPPDLETFLSGAGRPRTPGEPQPESFGMPPNLGELLANAGFGPM